MLTDTQALDLLQRLLRAPEWDSAADYIEIVAALVEDTGRAVAHPADRPCGGCGPEGMTTTFCEAVGR